MTGEETKHTRVVEEVDSATGNTYRHTYEVTRRRVSKRVVERREKFKKFGDCEGQERGLERGITAVAEPVSIELVQRTQKQQEQDELAQVVMSTREIKSETWQSRAKRLGGASSWADLVQNDGTGRGEPGLNASSGDARAAQPSGGRGAYVPPSLRSSGAPGARLPPGRREDEFPTLRITNLPEDADEDALRDMFRKHGAVQRVFLARDKATGLAKGFAFVSYFEKSDGERAIKELDGTRFGYLILQVEWAKPRT